MMKLSKKQGGIVLVALLVAALGIVFISQQLAKKQKQQLASDVPAAQFESLRKRGLSQSQIDLFQKSLGEHEADTTAKAPLLNIGYTFMDSGQYTEAEKAFKKYLEHESTDQEARLGLARSLVAQERYIDTEAQLIELLRYDPFYERAYDLWIELMRDKKLPLNRTYLDVMDKGRELDTKGEYDEFFARVSKNFTLLQAEYGN